MKKDSCSFFNIFSPNFMIRYAPGHMRNLSKDDVMLNYANLYSTNKTSEIEDGLSAILGFDFTTNEKMTNNTSREKLSISLGLVFNIEEKQSKNDPLVVYCGDPGCGDSEDLAYDLKDSGFMQLYVFKGGWVERSEASYPSEVGQ